MAKTMTECPKCGGTTDTGGECNACGFDWENDSRAEKEKFTDEWLRLTKSGTKEEIAEFMRFNSYGNDVDYYPYKEDTVS